VVSVGLYPEEEQDNHLHKVCTIGIGYKCREPDCLNYGETTNQCANANCRFPRCILCNLIFVQKEGQICSKCMRKGAACADCGIPEEETKHGLMYADETDDYICQKCAESRSIVEKHWGKSSPCRLCGTPYPAYQLTVHGVCVTCDKDRAKFKACANPVCENKTLTDNNLCMECQSSKDSGYCTNCGIEIPDRAEADEFGWCEICLTEADSKTHMRHIVCRVCKESKPRDNHMPGFCEQCASKIREGICPECNKEVEYHEIDENGICFECSGEPQYWCAGRYENDCGNKVHNNLEYCIECKLKYE